MRAPCRSRAAACVSLAPLQGSPWVCRARTFRAIYDAWFEDVSRWIRALGGLDADRDDIVQEVFLVVRRRLTRSTAPTRRLALPHHAPAGPRLSPSHLGQAHLHGAASRSPTTCPTRRRPAAALERKEERRCCTRC